MITKRGSWPAFALLSFAAAGEYSQQEKNPCRSNLKKKQAIQQPESQ
jgi:hypothetical protein